MKKISLRIKKTCFLIVASSITLASYKKYNKIYIPNHIIIEDKDYFAKYSNGKIYIGTDQYISSIKNKVDYNDVLVIDERNSNNPSFKILSSYKIHELTKKAEIVSALQKYDSLYPSSNKWDRSTESLMTEWDCHNMAFLFGLWRNRSADVDLDNKDEEKYLPIKKISIK